jgi:hypothetical protein
MVQVRVSTRGKALFAQAAAANKSITTWAREHLETAALRELGSAQPASAPQPAPYERNHWGPQAKKRWA